MSLREKIIEELSHDMDTAGETDIAFFGLWVSRRADGSLKSTACNIEEEPLTDKLREEVATVLLNLSNIVCPIKRDGWDCPECGAHNGVECCQNRACGAIRQTT